MTQREEFEFFCASVGFAHISLLFNGEIYADSSINNMWLTWQAAKAQAVPEWIPVYERLPDYLKPVWIIVDGKVNKYQWLCDAGDYGCWFEPHTIDFHEKECLDIDRVEMWAYCDLPPAAPEQPE